jgi:hypothetical protein
MLSPRRPIAGKTALGHAGSACLVGELLPDTRRQSLRAVVRLCRWGTASCRLVPQHCLPAAIGGPRRSLRRWSAGHCAWGRNSAWTCHAAAQRRRVGHGERLRELRWLGE